MNYCIFCCCCCCYCILLLCAMGWCRWLAASACICVFWTLGQQKQQQTVIILCKHLRHFNRNKLAYADVNFCIYVLLYWMAYIGAVHRETISISTITRTSILFHNEVWMGFNAGAILFFAKCGRETYPSV